MSKAFTDEEASAVAVVGRAVQRAARGAERPITPEGHRRLFQQLEQLRSERAQRATAGDLGRDAALAELDHRLALVSATLESVHVVEPGPDDGRVRFGSTVTLRWGDGRTQTLSIVGPDEADAKAGRVSVDSPLARELLELARDDSVEIERPRGLDVATVISVVRGAT